MAEINRSNLRLRARISQSTLRIVLILACLLTLNAYGQNTMRFHVNNVPTWTPLNLGSSLLVWFDAADVSSLTIAFTTTGTTGTGTAGSNTVTSAANIATLVPAGTQLHLGADTTLYTVTSVSTTTITVTPALVTSYSAQTIYRALVSAMKDKSGKGRTVSNATASTEPIFMASTINRLPGLFFSGTQFLTTSANATWLSGSSYSLAAMAQLSTTGGSKVYPMGSNGTTTDGSLHWGWRSNTDFTLAQYGDDGDWTTSVTGTLNPTLMLTNKISNSSSTTYLNGTALSGTVVKPSANFSAVGTFNVGCGFSQTASNWYGYIGEWVIVQTSLSTVNQQRLEGYLAWKWGTQGNLPAGHPFKNYPP